MDRKANQTEQQVQPPHLPRKWVELDAHLVEQAEQRAKAFGLTVDRYIGNVLGIGMQEEPLPEEQQRIDEFLSQPGRRAWLDAWRQRNAVMRPPTMADISAAYQAEEDEVRDQAIKGQYEL